MKELLSAVFIRKSVRKYSQTKLTNEELTVIENYLRRVKPLIPDLKVEYEIVPCKQTNCKFNAEYCLIVYSEEKDLWLTNVGYLIEQWELYLATLNIGACWYGMGKVDETEKNGLKYAIMVCFGKCDETEFRNSVDGINRKQIDGLTDTSVAKIAMLAPSAVNSQPWKVVQTGNTLQVYRQKGRVPVLSSMLFKHWNKVDIGIFLVFLEIALESEGYAYERQIHPETDDKRSVLIATYTVNKQYC